MISNFLAFAGEEFLDLVSVWCGVAKWEITAGNCVHVEAMLSSFFLFTSSALWDVRLAHIPPNQTGY